MNKFTKFCLIAFLFLSNVAIFAQTPGGDGGPQEDPDPTPINSTVIVLVFLGLALAFKAFSNKRKIA